MLLSANDPLPLVMPIPVSKKHPPPNDTPTCRRLDTAEMKAAVYAGSDDECPFASDQYPGASGTLMRAPETDVSIVTLAGFDHQYAVSLCPAFVG